MKIYHHSSRGSALLIALVILILLTTVTTVFLERIWGSSQTVQGIEASNAAYYHGVGIIEAQLIGTGVTKKTPWNILPVVKSLPAGYTGKYLDVLTGSSIMPSAGRGNSPYDDDYNIIALGQPVQIVIPDGIDWNNVDFHFRVPSIGSGSTTVNTTIMGSSGVILWTLGYSGASLYASGETNIIKGLDIGNNLYDISSLEGTTNSGSSMQFNSFYTDPNYLGVSGVRCAPYNCTLKLSMIRPILTADGISLPFLEYKITFNKPVPAQFMVLDATAYSYGFQRTKTVRIPQITTNTALDFAVLQ